MKLSQAQLKQIIKEELQKVIEAETQGPVIPELTDDIQRIGMWRDVKDSNFPNEWKDAINQLINTSWDKNQMAGKYSRSGSNIVAYGYKNEAGELRKTCKVFIPDNKWFEQKLNIYKDTTEQVEQLVVPALNSLEKLLRQKGFTAVDSPQRFPVPFFSGRV